MPPTPHHETEIKLRVANLATLRMALRTLGARLLHRVHERNTLFDTPRQRLRKNGQLLRLRLEYRPGTSKTPLRSLFTYKGPSLRPLRGLPTSAGARSRLRYKVREEFESVVSDPRALTRLLAAIGLAPSFRYEKYRTTYRLPGLGHLLIELDETPIGVFLELEGSPRSIDRASRLLGFKPRDYLVASYAGLYFDYCRRHRRPPGDMSFGSVHNSQKKLRRAPLLS